ncbi:hypothetical protein Ae201684P_016576 [Aphanomyces euteiches]|nr:hypothetical protein Ae201684P_016576 [Aphanomyces euteiches]
MLKASATSLSSLFKNKKTPVLPSDKWNPLIPPLKHIGLRFIDHEKHKNEDSGGAVGWSERQREMLEQIAQLGDNDKPKHLEKELIELMLDDRNVWVSKFLQPEFTALPSVESRRPNQLERFTAHAYEKLTFYHLSRALKWLKLAFAMVNAKTRGIDEDELLLWWLHNYKNEADPQAYLEHNQSLLKTTELLYQMISCALYLYQPSDVTNREIPGIPGSGAFPGRMKADDRETIDNYTQVSLPDNPFERFDDDVLELFQSARAQSHMPTDRSSSKKSQQSVDSYQAPKVDPSQTPATISLVTDLINAKFDDIRNMFEKLSPSITMPAEEMRAKESQRSQSLPSSRKGQTKRIEYPRDDETDTIADNNDGSHSDDSENSKHSRKPKNRGKSKKSESDDNSDEDDNEEFWNHLPETNSASVHVLSVDSLPIFSGRDESREVAYQWLKRFEQMARVSGWSEKERIAWFPSYLSPTIRSWYSQIGPGQQKTWKDVKRKFVKDWILNPLPKLDKYFTMIQEPKESLKSFFYRFNSAAQNAKVEYWKKPKILQEHILRFCSAIEGDRLAEKTYKSIEELEFHLDAQRKKQVLRQARHRHTDTSTPLKREKNRHRHIASLMAALAESDGDSKEHYREQLGFWKKSGVNDMPKSEQAFLKAFVFNQPTKILADTGANLTRRKLESMGLVPIALARLVCM